ncbi:hypothetical protein [Serinicoccus kebangsaanensis]|uniref:iron-sulfur cluster-binding protein n=1 Tax=Serinicoccus kebangsaanensis TaxID=2602069 RepID=UPI00192E05EC|nr:hypothetical protein [Serinicoccus kebangsaanensis]
MAGTPDEALGMTRAGTATHPSPVVEAQVMLTRASGAYDVLSLSVPPAPMWERTRPGQFLVLPGDPARGRTLPSLLWVAGVSVDRIHGTTVDVVVPAGHPLGAAQEQRLLGPLGRGFGLPAEPVPALVAGHEAAVTPLRWLVSQLRDRGSRVDAVLSADDPDRHLEVGALRRQAASVVLTTGAHLERAVTDRLDAEPELAVVFAAGSRPQVRAVAAAARRAGRAVRVAALDLAEPVLCGTGICGQCDVPVDGGARMLRACLEGPVVPGEWLVDAAG